MKLKLDVRPCGLFNSVLGLGFRNRLPLQVRGLVCPTPFQCNDVIQMSMSPSSCGPRQTDRYYIHSDVAELPASSCTRPKPQKRDRTSAALNGTGNRTLHPWNRPLNLAQKTDAAASQPGRHFWLNGNRLYITVSLSLSVPVAAILVPRNIGTAVSPALQNHWSQVPQYEDYLRLSSETVAK